MRRTSFENAKSSIARSLEIVGDWWTLLIVRDAFMGVRRFDDFQEHLGIARNILAARIRRLIDFGILERQLLATSFVPREITDELAGFSRFLGGCVLCATMEAEEAIEDRVVMQDDETVTISPFWASQPYEMLIIPKKHGEHLHKATEAELDSIATSIKLALGGLRDLLGDIAYNLVFHSSPYREHGRFHWHVHILPKLTTRAGFELGTGVMINIVPPEKAASDLRPKLSASRQHLP